MIIRFNIVKKIFLILILFFLSTQFLFSTTVIVTSQWNLDLEACEKINNTVECYENIFDKCNGDGDCYMSIAIKVQDKSYCEKIRYPNHDNMSKSICHTTITALSKDSINTCLNFNDTDSSKYYQRICIVELAIQNNHPEYCYEHSGYNLEYCYYRYFNIHSTSDCNSYDSITKNYCYLKLSEDSTDISICENISVGKINEKCINNIEENVNFFIKIWKFITSWFIN